MATNAVPAAQPGPAAGEDPGKTLGIVGLILAIVLSVVGLIISIVAFTKSKKAGFKNGIALAGIVVGVITTLGAIGGGVAIGVSAAHLASVCKELGSGTHQQGGVTYTCP